MTSTDDRAERPRGLRSLQATFVVVAVVLLIVWMTFGQGASIQPVRADELLSTWWMILWWSSPALLLFVHRSRVGTLVTGTALLAAGAVGLLTIYTSSGSTAAIGFLTLPVLFWALAAALLLGEYLMMRPWLPCEHGRS